VRPRSAHCALPGRLLDLRPDRRDLARNLIYPVPDPAFPFLASTSRGVWTRLGVARTECGARVSREGYGAGSAAAGPRRSSCVPGFQKLATKFWKTGMQEMVRDFSKGVSEVSAGLRARLTMADLLPGPSGVRAQAWRPTARSRRLRVQHQGNRVVHVRNAPPPARRRRWHRRQIADTAAEAFACA